MPHMGRKTFKNSLIFVLISNILHKTNRAWFVAHTKTNLNMSIQTKNSRRTKHLKIMDFKEDPFLSVLRPLVETYLAFYRTGSRHIESMGLTPSQFDVIAELGDTDGLTCADLSDATLVTKGTLTGVLDRLEKKGIVKRETIAGDRRAIKVRLTSKGNSLFRKVFPTHAEFLRPYFENALSPLEIKNMKSTLMRLKKSFEHNEHPNQDASTLIRVQGRTNRQRQVS
jgi:MarR family 2-MHQ and catechol resistance regulon transcriptional repressor